VTVEPDGSMFEERWSGLAGVREALDAASPFDKVLVPDDAGRKVWTHLDATEDEPPAAVPEPEQALASRRVDPRISLPLPGRERTLWIPLRSPDPRRIGRLCAGLVRGRGSIWVTGPTCSTITTGKKLPSVDRRGD
jgi:hypothetical protein